MRFSYGFGRDQVLRPGWQTKQPIAQVIDSWMLSSTKVRANSIMVTAKECNKVPAAEMDFRVCKGIAYKPRKEVTKRAGRMGLIFFFGALDRHLLSRWQCFIN